MIKTLRITTIVAAILAAVFFILPVAFGVRNDEEFEKFLASAGVVKKFNKATTRTTADASETSPLLKQAEVFTRIINPPPPPKPVAVTPQPTIAPTPIITTPKFTLVGISFYQARPEMSFAFIDEPGKGLRWVRQGSSIGHLVLKEVKDGLVVVSDGQTTSEIKVLQTPQAGFVNISSPVSSTPPALTGTKTAAATLPAQATTVTLAPPPPPPVTDEETALIEQFMKSLQANDAGAVDPQNIDALFADLGSMRVGPDEAEKLKDLPKQLQDPNQDPNRITRGRKVQRPTSLPKLSPPPK